MHPIARARTSACLGAVVVGAAGLAAWVARPALAPTAAAAVAQSADLRLEVSGQLGGRAWDVAVEGDRAYLGLGRRLVVLDLSDPAHIRELGHSPELAAPVTDLVAVGGGWVAAAGQSWDASEPAAIQAVRPLPGVPLAAGAGMAYVAYGSELVTHDVAAGTSPSTLAFASRAVAMAATGDRWVVLQNPYDIDEGAALRMLQAGPAGQLVKRGVVTFPRDVQGLAVAGDRAYVYARGVIRVVDLTDPAAPRELGWTPAQGHYLCFADMAVAPPYAFLTDMCSEELRVVDLSRPALARVVARVPLSGSDSHLALTGTRLTVSGGTSGSLEVFDVGEPTAPRRVGRWLSVGSAWGVALQDDALYVSEVFSGFQVLDVADPDRPRPRGRAPTSAVAVPDRDAPAADGARRPTAHGALAERMAGAGAPAGTVTAASGIRDTIDLGIRPRPMVTRPDGVAVMQGGYSERTGLQVLDVRDPDRPRRGGRVELRGATVEDLVGRPDTVFTGGYDGLTAIDWQDPDRPRVAYALDSGRIDDWSGYLALWGDDLYLLSWLYAAPVGGLFQVVHVPPGSEPQAAGVMNADVFGPAAAVGGRVYVAMSGRNSSEGAPTRLVTVDVANPYAPRVVAGPTVPLPFEPDGVTGCAGYLAVWGWPARLALFSIVDPDQPTRIVESDLGTRPSVGIAGVACRADRIFVAAEDRGILVLRMVPATVPTGTPAPSATPRPLTPPPASWPSPTATRPAPATRLYLPLALQGAAMARVDDGRRLSLATQIGGITRAVAGAGRQAWLGVGEAVHVLDIADPAAPRLVGRSRDLGSVPLAIALAGDHAWVAAGSAGLVALDAGRIDAAPELGRLRLPGPALDVVVTGGHAFVAAGDAGLWVVDIADPARPRAVASLDWADDQPLFAWWLTRPDDLLVVGDSAGLWVVDVSDPLRPRVRSQVAVPAERAVAQGALVLAQSGRDELVAVDVGDPDHPAELGRLRDLADIDAIAVRGDLALVLTNEEETSHVHTVDVARPAAMAVLGSAEVSPEGMAVTAVGDMALVAVNAGGAGLRLVDVARPGQPAPRGAYDTPHDIANLALAGGRLLVGDGNWYWNSGRLWSLAANPADYLDPVLVATLDYSVAGPDTDGRFAYIADAAAVRVFDVADAAHPAPIASVPLAGSPAALALGDGFVVVAHTVFTDTGETGYLSTVDVSDPRNPGAGPALAVSDYELWYTALATYGRFVYVPSDSWPLSLRVYRAATGGSLEAVGELSDVNGCQSLARLGQWLYCADYDGRLVTLELADPAVPRVVGMADVGLALESLAVDGATLYGVGDASLLGEIDVRDPAHPYLRAAQNLASRVADGWSPALRAAGGRLYVGARAGGIAVYDWNGGSGAGPHVMGR